MQVLTFQNDQKFWQQFKPAIMKIEVGILRPHRTGKITVSDKFFRNQKGTACSITGHYTTEQKPVFDKAIEALRTVPNVLTSVPDIIITNSSEERKIDKPKPLADEEIKISTECADRLSQFTGLYEPARRLRDHINETLRVDGQIKSGTPDFVYWALVVGDVPNALEALKAYPRIMELVDPDNLQIALEVAHRDYQRGPAGTDRSPPFVKARP